ncbi:MAG: phosphatase PAP2 family protein [Candidatus Cloacimonetes bacterium]|nr:phosphatase PAP2 family protein [Candidatus Cloacimonadota bacterium]
MKKTIATVILTVLLFSTYLLDAQDHNYYINKEFIVEGFQNTYDVYTSPVRWDAHDWLKAGIFTGTTILLFSCDEKVQDFVQDHKSDVLTAITDATNLLGDGYVILPAEALLYCYGAIAKDQKARRISLEMLESFAIAGVAVNAIKILTHRHRPSSSDSPHEWDGPSFSTSNLGFPSGHACVAFSWATVLAEEFKDKPGVGIVSYSLAACTAFARVYKNKHWLSDVFVGSLLSHFITKKIIALHAENDGSKVSFSPLPSGFSINFTF